MLAGRAYFGVAHVQSHKQLLTINNHSGGSSIQDFSTIPISSTGGFLLVLGLQYDSAGLVSGE